ncbi:MAG: TonB-dependent receptor plug domain-containing protein [Reichenbachiella sp.]
MKLLIPNIILTCYSFLSFGQESAHDAWLDSIQSGSYVGIEVTLDEMVLEGERDSLSTSAFKFYKNNPLNSTDEVLSRLASVSMVRRGNYAWEPTINGLNGGQITVTLDGMRMFGACTDKMDPISSYVEPNNLESIRIEQGSGGSTHGSSVGGAVNFNLKKPQFNNDWSGEVNTRYESVSNGTANSVSLNFGKQNIAVRINAGYRNYQDYTDGNGDNVFPSGYEKLNFSLASSYQLKNNNLLNLDLLIDDAFNVGYPGLPMDVAFAKARIAALSYVLWKPASSIDQLELKVYANSIDHLMDDSQRMDIPVRMNMPGNTRTFGAFATANLILHPKHKIETKIDAYSTNAYAEMTMYIPGEIEMFMITWPDVDRHNIGWYISDNISMGQKLSLGFNTRIEFAHSVMKSEMGKQQFSVFGYTEDDYKVNDLVLNLGSSLSFQHSKSFSTKFALSYGERLPTVSELYGFFLYNSYDGYDYLGNPTIQKEKSAQFSISGKYKIKYRLEIDLRGFYYRFDDFILGNVDPNLDAMTIGAKGVKVYENIEGVTFKGFDFQATYNVLKSLQILYAMKATYASDGEGKPLPLIPPLKNNLTMVFQNKKFKVQGEGEWSLTQNRNSESTGEQPTDGYYLFNIRLSNQFDINKTSLTVSTGVENILDTSYRDHLDWGGILRPGRNIYGSLSFKF